MKTFNRSSLPESIMYNGRTYILDVNLSAVLNSSFTEGLCCIKLSKDKGNKLILVNVLNRNLKSKTDLHGNLYKPNQYVFISE